MRIQSPGDCFFTGSHNGDLCLWRTADQTPVFSKVLTASITAAAMSHDGKRIVVAAGNEARLFDVSTGRSSTPPLVHKAMVRAVAFGHDDRLVLTASDDGTAQLWDSKSRARRGLTFSLKEPVLASVFSPDSRLVLTGSADGTARLWDVGIGRSVGPARPHQKIVCSLGV